MRQQTVFWLVKPELSLAGLTDTEALFGGAYIGLRPGDGPVSRRFRLHYQAPARQAAAPGLQLTLTAARAGSLRVGSRISYRNIAVGQVDSLTLTADGSQVEVGISIESRYRELVRPDSRFYHLSGISVSASVSGFKLRTESADNLLLGGLSFYSPAKEANPALPAEAIAEQQRFALYDDQQKARAAGREIAIEFANINGLQTGSPLKFHQQIVGEVVRVELGEDRVGMTAHVLLDKTGERLAREGSRFWIASAEVGLVANKHLDALISGDYIAMQAGDGASLNHFVADDSEPAVQTRRSGLNLRLNAPRLGSVRVGNPILFRQVKVGEIIGVDLSDQADNVVIFANIYERYRPLVQPASKFWNVSGVSVSAGLMSGVSIETESVEAILAGGIAFATPEQPPSRTQVADQTEFLVHEAPQPAWLGWRPRIPLSTGARP